MTKIAKNTNTTSTRMTSITNLIMMRKNTRSTTLKNTLSRTGNATHTSQDTQTRRKISTKVPKKLKRVKSEKN